MLVLHKICFSNGGNMFPLLVSTFVENLVKKIEIFKCFVVCARIQYVLEMFSEDLSASHVALHKQENISQPRLRARCKGVPSTN